MRSPKHRMGDTHPYDPGLQQCLNCGLIVENNGMENYFDCDPDGENQ